MIPTNDVSAFYSFDVAKLRFFPIRSKEITFFPASGIKFLFYVWNGCMKKYEENESAYTSFPKIIPDAEII